MMILRQQGMNSTDGVTKSVTRWVYSHAATEFVRRSDEAWLHRLRRLATSSGKEVLVKVRLVSFSGFVVFDWFLLELSFLNWIKTA